MTITDAPQSAVDLVNLTIDGIEVSVPKGTLIIRAAEQVGIQIPRFCDHPLLEPAGACRQCLVDVAAPRGGKLAPFPKPQASCTMEVVEGMVVNTQHTSAVADKAQHGVMELLLVNHPLDCPICDKGGECPLQNQAMTNGRADSRFIDTKRTFPKPIALTPQILLDRERCVLCQRCTRFSDQIAGNAFIALQKRGANQQIGTFDPDVLGFEELAPSQDPYVLAEGDLAADGEAFASYYSGNVIQICPVGALTSAAYRFRARPFDLVSTPSVSEHDSSGSAIRIDHRRGVVLRRLASNDPEVNEEWITDKDRFAFRWQTATDRITTPLVRRDGELHEASWAEAIQAAGKGLREARAKGRIGVLPGGRVTLEDAYAYSAFARAACATNDIDFRARPHSVEEEDFLAHAVAASGLGVTFADLEAAASVLMVGFEPEDEGGVVFLRLRKAVRAHGTSIYSIAPFSSAGLRRLNAELIPAAPGTEAEILDALAGGKLPGDAAEKLAGGIVIVGERLAQVPGGYSAALRAAAKLGARLAWIPRRAGERGALEVGALPNLLPGGRLVSDAAARDELAGIWGVSELPSERGRNGDQMLAAAAAGSYGALVVGGVELRDLPDPALARQAIEKTGFVVSLEVRTSAVTALADVVFPVAPPTEKGGTFVNWEGRLRPFGQVLTSTSLSDARVLDAIGGEMGVDLHLRTLKDIHGALHTMTPATAKPPAPNQQPVSPPSPAAGQAVLASWHQLLDAGSCQDGEPHLAASAKAPVIRLNAAMAGHLNVADGAPVTVISGQGEITWPVRVTDMPDGVVWLPANAPGAAIGETLGAGAGTLVSVRAARMEDAK